MKRNPLLLLCFFIHSSFVFAQQIDCEKIISFLNTKETQIGNLNLHDPDFIPLHFLTAKDIVKEFEQFRKDVIPNFTKCNEITFSDLINRYDELKNTLQIKYDSLSWLKTNVYLIYYEKALYEYQFHNETDAEYYLQRSLQYNDVFPNAILLKLNKLLDNNRFKECLLLLNTLYYDTQMDREQEMQSIQFTDNFYSKLYNSADSLVKIEHAAEALELFQILEIFCLNLPSSYCNDDYFHGVLRSKSGIYESYLAIAKVAENRDNQAIATHFYQYAQEYLETNPYLKNYESKTEVTNDIHHIETETPIEHRVIMDVNPKIEDDPVVAIDTVHKPELLPEVLKEKYDNMVLKALSLCIKEDFRASYHWFMEAKKLEDCRCFETNFRVDLMLKELEKIID